MSSEERSGVRSLIYSAWHREKRIRRYLMPANAYRLLMVDIDSCEACRWCKEPVALIETQASKKVPKQARVTAALARLAGIRAYSVSYEANATDDIVRFQVRQIHPDQPQVVEMLPAAYAYWLLALRSQHHRTAHPDIPERSD